MEKERIEPRKVSWAQLTKSSFFTLCRNKILDGDEKSREILEKKTGKGREGSSGGIVLILREMMNFKI